MSTSYFIEGFISDQDPTYKKHVKVLKACIEAEIKILPQETGEYFGSKWPCKSLIEDKIEQKIKVNDWHEDYRQIYEINVKDLHEGIERIRFIISG